MSELFVGGLIVWELVLHSCLDAVICWGGGGGMG